MNCAVYTRVSTDNQPKMNFPLAKLKGRRQRLLLRVRITGKFLRSIQILVIQGLISIGLLYKNYFRI